MWLSAVNAARKAGDFKVLYPRGVKRFEDVPWPLHEAISHALSILSWYENYIGDEIPNQNLWDDAEAVEQHFTAVQLRKEAEREGYHMSDDGEDDDMTTNDLAQVFKQ